MVHLDLQIIPHVLRPDADNPQVGVLSRCQTLDSNDRASIQSFLKACSEDADLRERISQAKTADEAVSIAKAAGLLIEPSELLDASRELTYKELEGAAGGNGDPFGTTFTCDMSKDPCFVFK